MKGYLDLVGEIEQAAGSPLGATTVAVFAIVEMGKQDSETAIATLQALLEQEEAPSGRTVIRLGLKDLYEKAGNREAAIEQLAAIVRENAEPLKGQEQRRPGQPPPLQR
jgi:lipopolysaccharide biosynthesis regulator YciM